MFQRLVNWLTERCIPINLSDALKWHSSESKLNPCPHSGITCKGLISVMWIQKSGAVSQFYTTCDIHLNTSAYNTRFCLHWFCFQCTENDLKWLPLECFCFRRTFDFSCLDKVTAIWRTWGQLWSKKRLEKTNEGFSNPGYCSRFIRPLNKITEINKIILITLSHWSSSGFISERKYWLSQENILLLKSVW